MKRHVLILIILTILNFNNCSVDIEGAPCNPEQNNCPSGQYCSEDGFCKYIVKDVKKITDIFGEDKIDFKDTITEVMDITNDLKSDIEFEDTKDVYSGDEDIIGIDTFPDISELEDITDIYDGGCNNECNKGQINCIDKNSYSECIMNMNTKCFEWSKEIKYCDDPPDNICLDSNTLKIFNSLGECLKGYCEYSYKTIKCELGCENGKCKDCTPNCKDKECGDDGCGGSCGSCGNNAFCNSYKCVCSNEYGNCNNDWKDGCETNITNDIKNCGGCKNECKVDNGTPKCENKVCKIESCYFPYGDCDKDYYTGCEKMLSTIENCGDCDNDCTKKNWPNVFKYKCVPGFNKYYCAIDTCNDNYANCNGENTDGCEVNTSEDVNNCGECNKICDADKMHVVTPKCNKGSCDYDKCRVGWIDNNFSRTDGCETYSYFPKTYGLNNVNEEPVDIVAINGGDNGYFICSNNNSGILIIRLDMNGNIIWSKTISEKNGTNISANAIIMENSNDGTISYIITGSLRVTSGNKDLLTLKISDSGNLLWHYVYSTVNSEEGKEILKLNDGYLILGNQTLTNNDSDILLIKLNLQGQPIWKYNYSYKSSPNPDIFASESPFSIYPTPDRGYVIGGSTSLNEYDFLLIKLKEDGSVIKSVNFGGNSSDYGKTIIPLSNGYIIGGFTTSSGKGAEDIAVIFYNSDFSAYWSNTYGDENSNTLINMVPAKNGYIISGHTLSNSNSYEGLLMYISSEGNIIWQRSYGGTKWDMFINALPTFDGGFIAFGRSNSYTYDYDLWAVKIDSLGKVPGSCPPGLPSDLNLIKQPFNLTIAEYPIEQRTSVIGSPTIIELTTNDIAVNTNMQCTAP